MGGVFGCCAHHGADDLEGLLNTMASVMKHRPWYVSHLWADQAQGAGLGHMGIGVFNHGPQPCYSADRMLALVMAGELVVSASERADGSSDEQRALTLYETYGKAFIQHMKGAFVLALWDTHRQELIIANDRFGLYPLHYAHVNRRLIFAPEIKGVLCDPAVSRRLDMVAVAEYVRFQMLLGRKTWFSDVHLLPGGSLLCYEPREDRLSIERYWDFGHIPHWNTPPVFDDVVAESARLLKAAVQRCVDNQTGVYLSGGMDSRIILGFATQVRKSIPTITYGLRNCRDATYAAMLAQRAGSDHHYLEFVDGSWVMEHADFHLTLTEGAHSWIHSHGINTLPYARQHMSVNISGLGGDTLALLNPLFVSAADQPALLSHLFRILLHENTWPCLDEGEERQLFAPSIASAMIGMAFESLCQEMEVYEHLDLSRQAMTFWSESDRRMFQYYTIFSRSHIEQRFPFYDYDYFDFAASLPVETDQNRAMRRAIILRATPELASVPYDKDGLPIRHSDLERVLTKAAVRTRRMVYKKLGLEQPDQSTLYADYENWLRGELREWGEEILFSGSLEQRGLFNMTFVRSLWNRHQSGREVNFIGKIAPIMTLEMVLRFFDKMPE